MAFRIGIAVGSRSAEQSSRSVCPSSSSMTMYGAPAGVADIENGHEPGVIERARGTRLLLEALQALVPRRERLGKNLDRDVTSEMRVARAPHLSHAARSEWRADFVRPKPCSGCERHAIVRVPAV